MTQDIRVLEVVYKTALTAYTTAKADLLHIEAKQASLRKQYPTCVRNTLEPGLEAHDIKGFVEACKTYKALGDEHTTATKAVSDAYLNYQKHASALLLANGAQQCSGKGAYDMRCSHGVSYPHSVLHIAQ